MVAVLRGNFAGVCYNDGPTARGLYMSIRLEKPWTPLNEANVARLSAELGVFQLADTEGMTVFIGYAGGRTLFGLRGELKAALQRYEGRAMRFRSEITSQYLSRYEELLMIHKADHSSLPCDNLDEGHRRVGRISPG